ncbi:MAG: hypothetical protein GWN73_32705, partial [Actinobacteria bacterium]|nr:hypothetical protein [Actinomycetota bacterium]NIU69887.1 hypothetical protein [Actinomycetota bacterium]NIW31767.1 hypothetical protein [Actinomycetota bacterium]
DTIGAALAVATSGDTVVVGVGDYDETIAIPGGVSVQGACATGVRIAPTAGGRGAVTSLGLDARLSDVTIGGELTGVFLSGVDRSLSLTRVAIHGVKSFGMLVGNGAHIEGDEVSVR